MEEWVDDDVWKMIAFCKNKPLHKIIGWTNVKQKVNWVRFSFIQAEVE